MKLEDFLFYLTKHWHDTKELLLKGNYHPNAILGQYIKKEHGKGKRLLGIPTVLDRLIQQAIHQVLCPMWDKEFSESSFGFRPDRNAGQAIQQAKAYINAGNANIVNIDLRSLCRLSSRSVLTLQNHSMLLSPKPGHNT